MTRRLHARAMTSVRARGAWLACVGLLASGCGTFETTPIQRYQGLALPHPIVVRVYDFDTSGAKVSVPGESDAQDEKTASAIGHALALALVHQLTTKYQIVADPFSGPMEVPADTLVVHGQLVSATEGSATTRVLVGLGHGASELETIVRLYEWTPSGPLQLAAYRTRVESGDEPGILTTLPVGLVYQAFAAMDRSATATRATRELPSGIADAVDETARKWGVTLHALFMNETWF